MVVVVATADFLAVCQTLLESYIACLELWTVWHRTLSQTVQSGKGLSWRCWSMLWVVCVIFSVPTTVWRQWQVCGILRSRSKFAVDTGAYSDCQHVSRVWCYRRLLSRRLRLPWLSATFRFLCMCLHHTLTHCSNGRSTAGRGSWPWGANPALFVGQ